MSIYNAPIGLEYPVILCTSHITAEENAFRWWPSFCLTSTAQTEANGVLTVSLGTPIPWGYRETQPQRSWVAWEQCMWWFTLHKRDCSKPDWKVMKISYYRDKTVQISKWVTVVLVRQIDENYIFVINCGKRKKSLRRLRIHCTWASTILPSKTS